jgi:cAMP-binding proteins - catabolite gene activator and regulatory subunit of cAMP-dependent protein kinases
MKKVFEKIKENPLFKEIDYNEFEKMFNCIESRTVKYKKDEVVLMTGDEVIFIGLILSGGVTITKEDSDGNSVILTALGESDLFAEVFACAGIEYSPVTVRTLENSEILLINYKRIITTCASSCEFHSKLVENMLRLIAKKNLILNQKNDILSKRSIREKLYAFFDIQRGKSKKFTIPYNRDEMARYLCVDRSALSKELCKMRDEGIITFNKNEFQIL